GNHNEKVSNFVNVSDKDNKSRNKKGQGATPVDNDQRLMKLANPTANVNKNSLNINDIQNIDCSFIVVSQMPPSKSDKGDIEDPKITTNSVGNRDETYANALK
ncbi:hypothetical protein HHI36_009849, partial [Cryptolaemus montrouzieri]